MKIIRSWGKKHPKSVRAEGWLLDRGKEPGKDRGGDKKG